MRILYRSQIQFESASTFETLFLLHRAFLSDVTPETKQSFGTGAKVPKQTLGTRTGRATLCRARRPKKNPTGKLARLVKVPVEFSARSGRCGSPRRDVQGAGNRPDHTKPCSRVTSPHHHRRLRRCRPQTPPANHPVPLPANHAVAVCRNAASLRPAPCRDLPSFRRDR